MIRGRSNDTSAADIVGGGDPSGARGFGQTIR